MNKICAFFLVFINIAPAFSDPYTIDILPQKTCEQSTTDLSPNPGGTSFDKSRLLCDVRSAIDDPDPAGIGIGRNARVGWHPSAKQPELFEHYRTYFFFSVDNYTKSKPFVSAELTFYFEDPYYEGLLISLANSYLAIIYKPYIFSKDSVYSQVDTPIPALLQGSSEVVATFSLLSNGMTPFSVDVSPLIQYAKTISGYGPMQFFLAITIAPEDQMLTSPESPTTADRVLSGFSIVPKQQLSRQPMLRITYEDSAPNYNYTCGDFLCQSVLGEVCPIDCINGEQDPDPPVVEIGIETTCKGKAPNGIFKSNTIPNGIGGLGGLLKNNFVANGVISDILNIGTPCTMWYSSNDKQNEVIHVPVYFGEASSDLYRKRKIYYKYSDNQRIAKTNLFINNTNPKNIYNTYYTNITRIIPQARPGINSVEISLNCLKETTATFTVWDYFSHKSQITVSYDFKGDGAAPVIRPGQSDQHIVRAKYNETNDWYEQSAGDSLILDFKVESMDRIKSIKVEMDGQLVDEWTNDNCLPLNLPGREIRESKLIKDNVFAFSDRNGWRTDDPSNPGNPIRFLKISAEDYEGQVSTLEYPILLVGQSVRSSWDKVNALDEEIVLEQEGFFVNWTNGPGHISQGTLGDIRDAFNGIEDIAWKSLFSSIGNGFTDLGKTLWPSLVMFFQTYGVSDGLWYAAMESFYGDPATWIAYFASFPIYMAVLDGMSAWCTGYSIAFQEWRKGRINWNDFSACEKLDQDGNECSSSSPGKYCHLNCCTTRSSDDNSCLDNWHDNDALQYIGAMQMKTFTGEFLGLLGARVLLDYFGYDVEEAVDSIESAENSQGYINGKIFDKTIIMFNNFYSGEAHAIAPIRSQKLANGVHRVYVYDPNKEYLSYGMKCIDRSYTSAAWIQNCGSFKADENYWGYLLPLNSTVDTINPGAAEIYDRDSIGGWHRYIFDYILLLKNRFWSGNQGTFHFNEYQGGARLPGFMFYLEPQTFHGNPLTIEGGFMAMVGFYGTMFGTLLENLFDIEFDDIQESIDDSFAAMHGIFMEVVGWVTGWKSNKIVNNFYFQMPQISSKSKIYFFTTPSGKRAKLKRKIENLPYNMVLSGGGADMFYVDGFSGKVGELDTFELHPGFHRANFRLTGVSQSFSVKLLSTIRKEKRTATGEPAGIDGNVLFFVNMKISPIEGTHPRLEFEYNENGEKFEIRNLGKTTVSIDLVFYNSFDPYVESGSQDELNRYREQLDLPNRKVITGIIVNPNEEIAFSFTKWWDLKNGQIEVSYYKSESGKLSGCSCDSVGKKTSTNSFLILLIFAILLILRKKNTSYLAMFLPVLLMAGCPASPPKQFLFTVQNVIKIDLKNQGLCKKPLFIVSESKYLTEGNDVYNYKNISVFDAIGFDYTPSPLNRSDQFGSFPEECTLAIAHASSVSTDEGILNYTPYAIPLAIHVKNLCTQEEFHVQGNLTTTNILLIPECKKMMDGWDSEGDSVPENCLRAIPSTVTAEFTPATDFDWSQYPQWELYRDYYNCEDFQ